MDHDSRPSARQLESLKERLLTMGSLAEERVRLAMRGLVGRDPAMLADVAGGDRRINDLHLEIDDHAFQMLALFQPVAVDLRTIVSVVKMNGNLERVGDLAVNIAEAAQRYLTHAPVKPLIDLPRMGALALTMLRDAMNGFVRKDLAAAHAVLRQDDWLDALKDQILRELLVYMIGNARTVEPSINLILISRHLERIGDHATNIAEDVIFMIDGRDVRHRSVPQAVERRRPSALPPLL